MKPTNRWTALDRQTYRITWRGMTWTLAATPGAKYPWLLTNTDGIAQEIGQPDATDARGMAEFWLEISTLCGPATPWAPLRAAA